MLFFDPIAEFSASTPSDLKVAFVQMELYRKKGFFLVGYINYEATREQAHAKSSKQHDSKALVLQFYAFNEPLRVDPSDLDSALESQVESEPYIDNISLSETHERYLKNLKKIHQYIYDGETYQVNYTIRMSFELHGEVLSLYKTLRQRQAVEYSALLLLPNKSILSLSPELFIEKKASTLTSKPMKGTSSRGSTPELDAQVLKAMKADPKQRSENLMIVDLMRNDIGKLAKVGSMEVESLFQIQSFATLHQMISTVRGEVDSDISFQTIVDSLFPCGSITGAPKVRTMEIINELESTPRGIYTGAIGYITPNNDFTFSVPIRTIEFDNNSKLGNLGIGGGIIYESDAEQEWQECLLKAKFLTGINQDFSLIESFRLTHKPFAIERYEQHLKRLQGSAQHFNFLFDAAMIKEQIETFTKTLNKQSDHKVRLLLNAQGQINLSAEPLSRAEDECLRVCISERCIDASSPYRRHKTTRRTLYNQEYARCIDEGYYDVIFLNQKAQIAEASRHNIFIEKDGTLITPPTDSGALAGIFRQQLLNDEQQKTALQPLYLSDLQAADKIFLTNSVRGIVEVTLAT
jgi:para-aminobenzoate synthetase/4-amino-4-deoxychorismate lyase